MKKLFTEKAWDDINYWISESPETYKKIKTLIKEIERNPFRGIGKPEPLKHQMKGYWSRRMTQEHRLVYKVEGSKENQILTLVSAKGHY